MYIVPQSLCTGGEVVRDGAAAAEEPETQADRHLHWHREGRWQALHLHGVHARGECRGGRVLQGLSLLFKDCSRGFVRNVCLRVYCHVHGLSKTCLMLSLVVDGLSLLSKDLFKGHC